MTLRVLRGGLVALCAGLAVVVITEVSVGALGSTTSLAPETKDTMPLELPMPVGIDAMIAGILERPLFTSSRLPYEEPVAAAKERNETALQPLRVRLMGVAILPAGREALFERQGSKPVAVQEGGQIDGWTVKAIRTDRVVLSSTLGEEVLEPTNAAPGIRRPQVAVNGANRVQARQEGTPTPRAPQPTSGRLQDQK